MDTNKNIKINDQVNMDGEIYTVKDIWLCRALNKWKCELIRTVDLLDDNVKFKPITSTFVSYVEQI